ncbi:class I SAM-dependent methyltransferase [Neobacillus sp. MER 74]|uniref:class I SAM-dependent methyltransferase n=1 Tax=Bacillaceae TaxID=186817 RepID=UPI000BF6A580|nr:MULTISPECIES: class I SAM-dependent methyltransferase [Bacillaceae]MCM3113883.1 class I SAM-dependent methyltransferase [Neobacillus sp. MER 74]PFP30742.1 SAM-dependent methyltransferase [Bacillus sp. AFS073361]
MKSNDQFTGKAEVYAKYRPSYPPEYIEYIISKAGLNEDSIIADIGSGTGILSGQLIDRGFTVIGVEPNDDMRTVAEQALKTDSRFISIKGTAENTSLTDNSINLVTVAQAFHWFDMEPFKLECQRILHQDGKVALVWNSRDGSSDINKESAEVCQRYCPNFKGFSGGMEETPIAFQQFFKDGKYDLKFFHNDLQFNLNGFLGRYLSASYSPKKTDEEYHPFLTALSNLFSRYSNSGQIVIPNITRSYLGIV